MTRRAARRRGPLLPAVATDGAYFLVAAANGFSFVYAAAAALVLTVLRAQPAWLDRAARRLAAWGLLPMLPALALAVADAVYYPATRHFAHPSTGPDAMIVPVLRLLAGVDPYAGRLWDGAPISPGPGWLLLNAPLTASGLIVLFSPVWLAWATWLVGARHAAGGLLFAALLFACRNFLVQSAAGHDIFAVNLAVAVVCLLAPSAAGRGKRLVAVAVLAGCVLTARVPMIVLLPVFGLALGRGDRRDGWLFVLVAGAVALALHGGFAAWAMGVGDAYQPLHVLHRAAAGAGPLFLGLAVGGGLLAGWLVWRLAAPNDVSLLLCCWLLEFALFAPVGVGELVNVAHFNLAQWEGQNYVGWSLPLLCAYLSLTHRRPARV